MKLPCTINGEPAEVEIDEKVLQQGALKRREAAKYLGIGISKLALLAGTGQVVRTEYGTYPILDLNAHLIRERKKYMKTI